MNRTFSASFPIRCAFLLVLVAAPILSWSFRNADGARWLHLLSATGVICVFFAWPRPIHCDSACIWQRNWAGKPRRIPWPDVDSLAYDISDDKVFVGGGDTQIVHALLHSDKQGFCDLIEQRTSCKLAAGTR
jgi:hypothetical protein